MKIQVTTHTSVYQEATLDQCRMSQLPCTTPITLQWMHLSLQGNKEKQSEREHKFNVPETKEGSIRVWPTTWTSWPSSAESALFYRSSLWRTSSNCYVRLAVGHITWRISIYPKCRESSNVSWYHVEAIPGTKPSAKNGQWRWVHGTRKFTGDDHRADRYMFHDLWS